MVYLFSDRDKLREILKDKFIYLFLDYDGTLVPIRDTPDPERSILPPSQKNLLRNIMKCGILLAIVSGRSLKDLKRMAGIKGVIYSGNHGMEIEGPGIRFGYPVKTGLRRAVKRLGHEIQKGLGKIKGVFIEDKGLTFSVHYRLAKKTDIPRVKGIVVAAARPYVKRGQIAINEGKKILEVKPAIKWDKGKMVSWLISGKRLKSSAALPVYIGDDTTDEDAFRALGPKGITIFVGKPRNSRARYYIKGPAEVQRLLKTILTIRKGQADGRHREG
jgi:trehalose-phosphatase